MTSDDKLRNIGPKSAAWLRQTGIRTQADLDAVGSLAAYVRVKRAGFKPSLNLLYALEGAILGCHWQEIPEARRSELVLAAGEEVAKLPLPKNKRKPDAAPVKEVLDHSPEDVERGLFGRREPMRRSESPFRSRDGGAAADSAVRNEAGGDEPAAITDDPDASPEHEAAPSDEAAIASRDD